jgi:hypothetical protein
VFEIMFGIVSRERVLDVLTHLSKNQTLRLAAPRLITASIVDGVCNQPTNLNNHSNRSNHSKPRF